MDIPKHFCWTRFGTESAQSVTQIIARKNEERLLGGGIFLWGIGNAVGRSIRELLRVETCPQVLFSAIKSAPKPVDVNPHAVVAWTSATGLDGSCFELPSRALVTSRIDPDAPRSAHYALVCNSSGPLEFSSRGCHLRFGALRNLATGRPVGASQVTAVVEYEHGRAADSAKYDVALQAQLVSPFFIRLGNPVTLLRNPVSGDFDFERARDRIYGVSTLRPTSQIPKRF
jgi:hypothetical protein